MVAYMVAYMRKGKDLRDEQSSQKRTENPPKP